MATDFWAEVSVKNGIERAAYILDKIDEKWPALLAEETKASALNLSAAGPKCFWIKRRRRKNRRANSVALVGIERLCRLTSRTVTS
jgi:hypothetical protein